MHQREQKKGPNAEILVRSSDVRHVAFCSAEGPSEFFRSPFFSGKQTALRINNRLHLLSALIYLGDSNQVTHGQNAL